ncbi:MAG: hypothetical protein IJC15_08205 [Clostridia bacterium]|nr:hypothetical protein [Clostridia bacterium]
MLIALIVALTIACYTVQSLFSKYFALAYDGPNSTASLVFATLFGGFIGIVTFLTGGLTFAPSLLTVILGTANAIVLVVYQLTMIGAAMRGSYAITNLCMLFGGILVPMFTSTLMLDQTLNLWQIIAVAVMLTAFLLLNLQGASLGETKRGFWPLCLLLFIDNGLYGALNSLQANLMAGTERTEMITISYLGSAILAFAAVAVMRRRKTLTAYRVKPRALAFCLGSCAAATIAVNLIMYLYTVVNTTVLSTLDNGGVMVTSTLCAIFLFGERPTRLQYCGLALALASIVMLSL